VIVYFTDHNKFVSFQNSLEESRNYHVDGQWSIRFDKGQPHIPTQDHIHFAQRGNEFLSINRDGSSHDNSFGRIPNKCKSFIEKNFPGFKLPPNGIVESSGYESVKLRFKDFYHGVKMIIEYIHKTHQPDLENGKGV